MIRHHLQSSPRKRVLCFAPHPDDETIGAGGFLALARKKNWYVKIVAVTRGELFKASEDLADIRVGELLEAVGHLGIVRKDVECWAYPDGCIPLSGRIIEDYRRIVAQVRPHVILLPAPTDCHADHRRVTRGVLKALQGQVAKAVELRFYEVVEPCQVNCLENISGVFAQKESALACFKSQLERHDYGGVMAAMAALRGASAGCPHGEGFLVFPWAGTDENFFEQRPLVSVIVRSSRRRYLHHALSSIMAQNYDHLEVVIVWFGDDPLDLPETFDYLDLTVIAGVRGSRGQNLNLGTDAARGDYVAFLDEDDAWDPPHIENLLSLLHAERNSDIAYAGCRAVQCVLREDAVERMRQERLFNAPFQKGRLLLENYIPLNALLFRRHVFRTLFFAEDLAAYEDWLLLARAELQGASFSHCGEITAEYRIFGSDYEGSHSGKGYQNVTAEIRKRILQAMKPEHLQAVTDLFDLTRTHLERMEESLNQTEKASKEKDEEYLRRISRLEENEKRLVTMSSGLGLAGEDAEDMLNELLVRAMREQPRFSILLSIYDAPAAVLRETLLSVTEQAYPHWQLCLVDDGSSASETLSVLEAFLTGTNADPRIRFDRMPDHSGISKAFNRAAEMATGEYLVLMDHDDRLHPEALLEAALARNRTKYRFLYTDSCIIDADGTPLLYQRKPDWAPETLHFMNYINHLAVIHQDLWRQSGGFRPEVDGSQDWDLFLRLGRELKSDEVVHIGRPLYEWRAIEGSTARRMEAKPWAMQKWEMLLRMHHGALHAEALGGDEKSVGMHVRLNPKGPGFFCRPEVARYPLIDVIIPSRDNPRLLSQCLAALEKNRYPQKRIIVVDNGSVEVQTRELLESLSKRGYTVLYDKNAFNWSRLNNLAADSCSGEALLFLNDDVIFGQPDTLRNLVHYLSFPGVGIVGPLLKFPDGKIQHNGIVTHPAYVAWECRILGRHGEFSLPRNVSAVTGACMLVKRQTFVASGGFDENLPVNYNDVDFCLRARKKGWRVMQAADIEAVHYHMTSRGKTSVPQESEITYMRNKWHEFLEERYAVAWKSAKRTILKMKMRD